MHETLAFSQGQEDVGRPTGDCVAYKAPDRTHKTFQRDGHPSSAHAFHEDEEIIPMKLSGIAKNTGLQPSDLRDAREIG